MGRCTSHVYHQFVVFSKNVYLIENPKAKKMETLLTNIFTFFAQLLQFASDTNVLQNTVYKGNNIYTSVLC